MNPSSIALSRVVVVVAVGFSEMVSDGPWLRSLAPALVLYVESIVCSVFQGTWYVNPAIVRVCYCIFLEFVVNEQGHAFRW